MKASKKLGFWSIGFWMAMVVWAGSGPLATDGHAPAVGFWVGFGALGYLSMQFLLLCKVVEYQEKKR